MPQLLIQIIDAQNIADTEIITKQDPYVVIRTDCDRQETFVCKDGGRNPRFSLVLIIIHRLECGKDCILQRS